MAVAAVIFARDVGELAHLHRIEGAIGNGDAQHIGVELEIEAVLQPQRLELVVVDVARDAAAHLIAELLDARIDHALVVFVILVHVRSPSRRPWDRRVSMSGRGARSGRARSEETTSELQSLMRISYAG